MDWTGKYYGDIQGTKSILDIAHNDNQLSGLIDAAGYRYSVQGNVSGTSSNGQVVDMQTQGQLEYQASLQKGTILFTFSSRDPYSGQTNSFQVNFSKEGSGTRQVGGPMQGQTQQQGNQQFERDQNIVGAWIYSESYSSGQFSFASQWKMQVNPDGTFLYGDAKVAGGGPGVSGGSGEGDITRGQWRTEKGIIYTNEGYGWQPYAKYYVEGYSMMLTFGDGSKQVWKRM